MSKLLTENQIIERFGFDWSKPKVAFLCTSFNQEDYIEDTINSFLSQETSFPYEIIIHDDKSTDKTQEIIKRYKKEYPRIINLIVQDENQYSKGYSTILIAARTAKSEYIAICEGDDYWISVDKAEKQYKLMSNDTSITMTVAPSRIIENGSMIDTVYGYHGENLKSISAQEILSMYNSLAATPSYMVKKEYLIKALEVFESAPVSDVFIELYNAVYGKIIYYPEIHVVFRKMSKNSWTERMAKDLNSTIMHTKSLEKTVKRSKGIKGFKELDWSMKLSNSYFNLAISHLNHNKFHGFKENIEISNSYKTLQGKKKVLFKLRNYPKFVNKILIPFGRYMKKNKNFLLP